MKYIRLGMLLLLSINLTQCNTSTLHTNEIALDLIRLERDGTISQSERKDDFMLFFEEEMISSFEAKGFGHRIEEIKENWTLYEDKSFLISTGSVAKTEEDIYVFTLVYKDHGEGEFSVIYWQIGQEKEGEYPDDIIPN